MKSTDDDAAHKESGGRDHHHHLHHGASHQSSRASVQMHHPETPQSEEEALALLTGISGGDTVHRSSKKDETQSAMERLEQRIRDKQRASVNGKKVKGEATSARQEPPRSFESLLERKQRAAASSDGPSAAEQVAILDRRIDAKRTATNNVIEMTEQHNVNLARDMVETEEGIANIQPSRISEQEENLDVDLQSLNKSDHDKDNMEDHPRESEDMFHEQGVNNQESEHYYPNVRTDTRIMAEIEREGIQLDEGGALPAYVADPVVIEEAGDVRVIKTDEEVEREERREYFTFFFKAVACIVFLIVIIGVPVTLKLTNVIQPRVTVTPSPTAMPSSMPSQSPSSMPSSIEFTYVVERLFPLSGDKLMDVGSPQYRAARWISDGDPMQLDINDAGFEQRYAMAVLYYSLDGDNWHSRDGWLSGESECNWEYVEGPGCTNGCIDGKVCAIKMEGWLGSQRGTFPDELSVLTEMRYFELQYRENDITGTIPSGIGTAWTKLTAFLVAWNRLHGPFPFVNNPLLGTIFFNGNKIEDNIQKIASLESLSWLEAETNGFTGTIPDEFFDLQYLWRVRLTNNSLSGPIPDLVTNSSLLERFLLSGNKLTGNLPASLANAPNLKKVELARNLLTGSIPSSYYKMQSLQELHIDSNNLGGSLSQSDEPLYFGIREFVINNNTFEGRFPVEQFEDTEILNVLALQDNQLTGTITQSICQRLNQSNPIARLKDLSADCDLIECDCCTCY